MDYATGIGLSCLLVGAIAGFCAGLVLRRSAYDRGYVDGADEERKRASLTPEQRLLAGVFRWQRTERLRHAREAVARHDSLPQGDADATVRRLLAEWGKW